MHTGSEIDWCKGLLPFFQFDSLRLHDMDLRGTTTKVDLDLNTPKMPIVTRHRQQSYLKSDSHLNHLSVKCCCAFLTYHCNLCISKAIFLRRLHVWTDSSGENLVRGSAEEDYKNCCVARASLGAFGCGAETHLKRPITFSAEVPGVKQVASKFSMQRPFILFMLLLPSCTFIHLERDDCCPLVPDEHSSFVYSFS